MRTSPRLRAAGSAFLLIAAGATLSLGAAATPAQAHPINAADFQQVTLAKGIAEVGEPMSIAVLPDRSVLHTARNGTLRRTDAAGTTSVVADIPVYTHDEEGLQGIAIDPGFATNRFIYLYYAPPLSTPAGDAPITGNAAAFVPWQGVNRLTRYVLNANFTLGASVTVLEVPTSRGICCHVGGDIDFDAAGNLYLTTGDDSNPFDSAGYSPLDERADRNPAYDAQRTAANTNDLRGKLLRIKVAANGTYTIPAGNLFAPGTANTRPEIYAMGFRNPFRMNVDKATGVVYIGDYGPDSGTTDPNRGPNGQVEYDRIASPGNYGWPYCTGTNTTAETYNEWNFATNSTGPKFNCAGGATNNSLHNTGLTTLPPARPSWIRYGGDAGSPPEFGGGSESPMAGPIYHFDAANPSTTKFPAGFEGQFFAGEFGRRFIKPIHVNADGSVGAIESLPWAGTQVMDMQFGPDGALYVLDYGAGFGNGDANSALYRIDFIGQGANRAPIAVAAGNPTSGTAPLTVAFSSAGSSDPDGNPITFSWAFGDGATSTAANPSHTYTANGNFTATLTVRDNQGATGTASVPITVGNTAPRVTLTTPTNGQLFSFGDTVPFTITVTDPEDGPISCSRVHLTYILGHDTHGHQITTVTGCTGSITTPFDGEHDAAANIFGVFDADYTDNGGITTHTQNILQPRHRQAEHFGTQSGGVQVAAHAAAEGGATAGFIDNNDWISFQPYNLSNATQFTARVASGGPGGTIEVRSGSATGPLHGTAIVSNTGGWDTYTNVTAALTGVPSGPTQLYLVFKGGAGNLFDVDAFTFTTGGTPPTGISTLKSLANNQFVSAANATTALIANKAAVGATERFDVIDLGGGNVALRSRANNMYVAAENAGAQPLIANRAAVGAWETFALIRNADGTESLRAGANNMYVVAENGGAQSLIANRAAIGAWEKFDLVTS